MNENSKIKPNYALAIIAYPIGITFAIGIGAYAIATYCKGKIFGENTVSDIKYKESNKPNLTNRSSKNIKDITSLL